MDERLLVERLPVERLYDKALGRRLGRLVCPRGGCYGSVLIESAPSVAAGRVFMATCTECSSYRQWIVVTSGVAYRGSSGCSGVGGGQVSDYTPPSPKRLTVLDVFDDDPVRQGFVEVAGGKRDGKTGGKKSGKTVVQRPLCVVDLCGKRSVTGHPLNLCRKCRSRWAACLCPDGWTWLAAGAPRKSSWERMSDAGRRRAEEEGLRLRSRSAGKGGLCFA